MVRLLAVCSMSLCARTNQVPLGSGFGGWSRSRAVQSSSHGTHLLGCHLLQAIAQFGILLEELIHTAFLFRSQLGGMLISVEQELRHGRARVVRLLVHHPHQRIRNQLLQIVLLQVQHR